MYGIQTFPHFNADFKGLFLGIHEKRKLQIWGWEKQGLSFVKKKGTMVSLLVKSGMVLMSTFRYCYWNRAAQGVGGGGGAWMCVCPKVKGMGPFLPLSE